MPITVVTLGTIPYGDAQTRMAAWVKNHQQDETQQDETQQDEIWIVEHPPVITLGISTRQQHIKQDSLAANCPVPVVKSNRGGKATCHNPGQAVFYFMINLNHSHLTIRTLVSALEQSIIELLAQHGHLATCKKGAPGVYVNDAKIASLGLRVQRGITSHGVSININNDISIFNYIHPCGNPHQKITSFKHLAISASKEEIIQTLTSLFVHKLTP